MRLARHAAEQAQANLVRRLLERFGALPSPEELRVAARREPGLMLPTSQMRTLRELEPPQIEKGFAAVERIEFVRAPAAGGRGGALLIAASALEHGAALAELEQEIAQAAAPILVFDWRPGASAGELVSIAARLTGLGGRPVQTAV